MGTRWFPVALQVPPCKYESKNILSVPPSASFLHFLKRYYIEKEVKWEAQMGTRWLPMALQVPPCKYEN